MSTANAHGFTLVELMVAQALGLAMMTVLVASLSSLYKSVQVSADAAENSETAYFLMDALAQWLSESRSPMFMVDSLSSAFWKEGGDESRVIDDPCGTPLQSALDFSRAGVAVVPAVTVSCLPSSFIEDSSAVLLVERRLPCLKDCDDAGFYVALKGCTSGHAITEWRSVGEASNDEAIDDKASGENDSDGTGPSYSEDGGSDSGTCAAESRLFQLHRMLIYVRKYSRRRGDGVPALMMSRLATELEPRWLRSDMLASGVFDWDLRERMGAQGSRAVMIGFSVKGKHQSTSIDRTIPLDPLQLEPRPVVRRPEARLALDLAWP